MKKFIITFIILLSILNNAICQEPVTDVGLISAITGAAVADGIAYGQIERNQTENTVALVTADMLQANILSIKQTTLTYMQQVQSILRDLYTIELITQGGTKIVNNLSEVAGIVAEDPELATVILDMTAKFSEETIELGNYIVEIFRGEGDHNLMTNSDRLTIVTHVKKEIYKLVGISNQMIYRMKAAKKHGLFRTLCPQEFYYARNCNRIATRILNNFHL